MFTQIKKTAGDKTLYKMTFNGLTVGTLMALRNALKKYDSVVADDVLRSVDNAIRENPELSQKVGELSSQ